MSEDQKSPRNIATSECGELSEKEKAFVINAFMEPIPVPEMGIPVDGKQTKKFPDSTNVFAVTYDFEAKLLTVEFANGGVYEYREVPVEVWRNIQRADSAGKVIAAEVRGKYQSKKIEPKPADAVDFPEL
jgi:hypothetical protein